MDIQPFVGTDLGMPSAGAVKGKTGRLAESMHFNWSPRGLETTSVHQTTVRPHLSPAVG